MIFERLVERLRLFFDGRRPAALRQARVATAPASARVAAQWLRAPTALMQLEEDDALIVVGYMVPKFFPADTVIIRQGDTGDTGFMLLVLEGEVTVEGQVVSRTTPVTLSVLGPGSLIGEMSLVDGAARSASCTASTDVGAALLTREALQQLTDEHPAVAAKLMIAIAQRLAERLRDNADKLRLYSQLVTAMQQEIDQLMPT